MHEYVVVFLIRLGPLGKEGSGVKKSPFPATPEKGAPSQKNPHCRGLVLPLGIQPPLIYVYVVFLLYRGQKPQNREKRVSAIPEKGVPSQKNPHFPHSALYRNGDFLTQAALFWGGRKRGFQPLRTIFGHGSDIFSTFFGHFVDIPIFWAAQRSARYKICGRKHSLDIFENPYGAPPTHRVPKPPSSKKKEIPKTPKTPTIPQSKRTFPESKRSFPKSKR